MSIDKTADVYVRGFYLEFLMKTLYKKEETMYDIYIVSSTDQLIKISATIL